MEWNYNLKNAKVNKRIKIDKKIQPTLRNVRDRQILLSLIQLGPAAWTALTGFNSCLEISIRNDFSPLIFILAHRVEALSFLYYYWESHNKTFLNTKQIIMKLKDETKSHEQTVLENKLAHEKNKDRK